MLDVGTHDARGGLRAERPSLAFLVSAPRLDAEELLLHDVGDLADAAFVHGRLLEEGRLDGLVPVAGGQVAGGLLEAQEDAALGGSRSRVPRGAWNLGIEPRV